MLLGRHHCLMLKIILLKKETDSCYTHWKRHSMFRRLFIWADDGTRDSFRESVCSIKEKKPRQRRNKNARVISATIAIMFLNAKRARVPTDHSWNVLLFKGRFFLLGCDFKTAHSIRSILWMRQEHWSSARFKMYAICRSWKMSPGLKSHSWHRYMSANFLALC
jgi:hypothetical protein